MGGEGLLLLSSSAISLSLFLFFVFFFSLSLSLQSWLESFAQSEPRRATPRLSSPGKTGPRPARD